ncbi:phage integrase N-terminal SAM-like domain-containing protein [Desulfitobacterium sp.]|uniref:phage integrase N-terminal SAM-like domain-containing protein n=1 Tax=Desulfitobacterium sp. TaxID=49981 RepID=UPI003BB91F1C
MTKEEVLAKLQFDVELRGLSKHTQAEYPTRVKIFQDHFNKPATELGEEDIRQFLHYLTTEKKLAPVVQGFASVKQPPLKFQISIATKCSCSFAMLKAAKIDMLCFHKPISISSEHTGKPIALKEWLFYSRNNTNTHILHRAIQNIFHKYVNIFFISSSCSGTQISARLAITCICLRLNHST